MMQNVVPMLLTGAFMVVGLLCVSCRAEPTAPDDPAWEKRRKAMVETLRKAPYEVTDEAVLNAMSRVRRHMFIPEAHRDVRAAYGDHPWSIGKGQTISQPFIVAYMTAQLEIKKGTKVLEIGTGSGFQAAVLAEMGADVYSIEIVPELAEHARKVLAAEGYADVKVLTGDGYRGWPEHAPFEAVIVTAAPPEIPQALVDQLADGGRMIVPVGEAFQRLVLLRRKGDAVAKEDHFPVRFVPMVPGEE